MNYDVVIIGSGIAGLTCALNLSKNGYKTCLIEKHHIPGGFATNFTRKGNDGKLYNFDVSLHSIGGAKEGSPLYENIKKLNLDSKVNFLRKNHSATIINSKNEIFDIPDNFEDYKILLKNRFPNEHSNLENLFDFLKLLHDDMFGVIKDNKPPVYYQELQNITLYDFLKKYTQNEELIHLFSFLWPYYGCTPKTLNALYYLIPWTSYHIGGSYYIEGGGGNFSKIIATEFKNNGGDLFLSTEIKKLNFNGTCLKSVESSKGESFAAKVFVFACDPNHIYSLIRKKTDYIATYIEHLKSLEIGISLSQLYVALDCKSSDIGINKSNLFVELCTHEKTLEYSKQGLYEEQNFQIASYDILDPSFNKDGTVLAITLPDFIDNWPEIGTNEYIEKKKTVTDILINKVAKLYPKILNHIQHTELGTPRTMEKYTNNSNGAVYGWAQTIHQGGFNRLPNQTSFKNGFLTGSWTNPGGGYEGAIDGGILTSNRIMRLLSTQIEKIPAEKDKLIPLDTIMRGMIANFQPQNSNGLNVNYEFKFLDSCDTLYIKIANKRATLMYKLSEKIHCQIITTHKTWHDVAFNNLDPQDALMDGKLKYIGDIRKFALMNDLFVRQNNDISTQNESQDYSKINSTIWVTLSLIPWIIYWIFKNTINPLLLSAIIVIYYPLFTFFIKPKSFRNFTMFEISSISSFLIYGVLSIISIDLFDKIKPFFLDSMLILTLIRSLFLENCVISDYSRMSFPPILRKQKLFKIINRNICLVWIIIFILRFLIDLLIPFPFKNIYYIPIFVGVIFSFIYPNKKLNKS